MTLLDTLSTMIKVMKKVILRLIFPLKTLEKLVTTLLDTTQADGEEVSKKLLEEDIVIVIDSKIKSEEGGGGGGGYFSSGKSNEILAR